MNSHLDSNTLMLLACHELEEARCPAAEQHIASCGSCQQEFQSIQEILKLYQEIPLEEAPREILSKIWTRSTDPVPSTQKSWFGWRLFSEPWGWALASACGIFLALGAMQLLRPNLPMASSSSKSDLSWESNMGDALDEVSRQIVSVEDSAHSAVRGDIRLVAAKTTDFEISDLDRRIKNFEATIEQEPTQYL